VLGLQAWPPYPAQTLFLKWRIRCSAILESGWVCEEAQDSALLEASGMLLQQNVRGPALIKHVMHCPSQQAICSVHMRLDPTQAHSGPMRRLCAFMDFQALVEPE
jgi:hypothetical protein